MKVNVTITLTIDDAKKYVDEQYHADEDSIRDTLESDIDEGNTSIDDLMTQDGVEMTVFVEKVE